MKPKIKQLLEILLHEQICTSAFLAEQLNVSIRSIKSYVHDINEEYPALLSSGKKGYFLNDPQRVTQILSQMGNQIPQSANERITYIINKLIHEAGQPLNIYDISEEIFVSTSTIRNDLLKVKRKLHAFALELHVKGDLITCIGTEKNKRRLLSSMLYKESNVNFVNLQSLQKAFVDIDIVFIRQSVLRIFDKYHYFINDYSLINLVLHITIAVDRIRHHYINNQSIASLPGIRLHEYALAKEMAKTMEAHFHIKFSDAEIYEMTLLIISRATTADYKSITQDNLESFIGKECLQLVKQLIEDINAFYYIDLSEPEFLIRFALHIRNLLVRSQTDYFSKNPLTENIKITCPLIYDAAVSMARIIREKTDIVINDDEIAYIAFHLGSTLEAQKNLTSKISAIVYCPNYYDLNSHLIDTINRYFEKELLIKNILTDESELELIKDIDLIIAMLPVSAPIALPLVTINPFLSLKDRKVLHTKITELQKEKNRHQFERYLRELILPEFFERKNDLKNEKECIDHMVKKLVKKGYVKPSFKKEIWEREQLSSTAFGNFAIPHAMKMYANKTAISIIISEEAILWDHHPVNLVMMMCFNKSERHIFNEIYDPITMILSEPENVRKILAAHDYEQFIHTLSTLYAF